MAICVSAVIEAPKFDHFIAENRHGQYCIPTTFAGREVPDVLASGGVYEPDTLDFLCRAVAETGRDIVTGGAFVGDFFPALSRAMAPDAQIHSFEPAEMNFGAAQETLRLNGLENVTLSQVAVGEREGILPLQIARKAGGAPLAAAARIAPGAEGKHVVPVHVRPLDDIIPLDRAVGVLHLDVEGHEDAALVGARGLIDRHRPIIVPEAGRPRVRRRYLDYLARTHPEIGYREAGLLDGNMVVLPGG